jgi:hypothetical protein
VGCFIDVLSKDGAASILDNPTAVWLTATDVERVLLDAGFQTEGAETTLPGITMLTKASKPV